MNLDRLKPHRLWLSMLAAALLLLFALPPIIQHGLDKADAEAKQITQHRAEIQEAAKRFDDDMHLAQQQSTGLNPETVERLLAPVDRLRVVSELEQQAAALRLIHFTYTLQPEKKAHIDAIDAFDLAESDLTVAGDMPLDTDAYAFIRSLNYVFPGHLALKQLTLTRTPTDTPLTLANIHMEATLQWLSNGSAGGT